MKTELQKQLALLCPSISIETEWSHDPDARFSDLTGPGYAFENENPDDWQAWQSEIRASVIVAGEIHTGTAYMGGTWEKYGDNPAESNPEISGYELQMTQEALEELRPVAPAHVRPLIEWLKAEAGRRYDESTGAVVAQI